MSTLAWIILLGIIMSAIALIGSFALLLSENIFQRIVLPLVALAAGTLIGGAFFHLLPESIEKLGNTPTVYLSIVSGFIAFFIFEQFLHWHHCHLSMLRHHPVSYLVLIADGLHNLIDGIAFGTAFLIDMKLGMILWLVIAAHEIPQELGDFGVLIYSGWSRSIALLFNLISALTFPLGALIAYAAASKINLTIVLPFAAGSFLYIASADLIPQLHASKTSDQVIQFLMFILGLIILFILV